VGSRNPRCSIPVQGDLNIFRPCSRRGIIYHSNNNWTGSLFVPGVREIHRLFPNIRTGEEILVDGDRTLGPQGSYVQLINIQPGFPHSIQGNGQGGDAGERVEFFFKGQNRDLSSTGSAIS